MFLLTFFQRTIATNAATTTEATTTITNVTNRLAFKNIIGGGMVIGTVGVKDGELDGIPDGEGLVVSVVNGGAMGTIFAWLSLWKGGDKRMFVKIFCVKNYVAYLSAVYVSDYCGTTVRICEKSGKLRKKKYC